MKKYLMILPVLFVHAVSNAAVIRWDGGAGDGQWLSANNWTGDVIPGATDNVVLDNSIIGGNYTVTLPGGAITVSILSIAITPGVSTIITLVLPLLNTANPGFNITGSGDALTLNNGAVFKNSSGATSGTGVAIGNTFRINNGGRYIHNTTRGNAAIVSQLSTATGTEQGIFEYDVPAASYTVSLSGRTYGMLELSTGASATSYVGSGASVALVRSDLKINTGASLKISMTADFIVQGNYSQATSSSFDLQTSTGNNSVKIMGNIVSQGQLTKSGTGLPVLELNGTVNQDVSMTGLFTGSVTFKANNPSGITLLSPLFLPFNLQLLNGKIKSTAAGMLIMSDNSTCTGGSTTSFVDGPMKKGGNDAFVFPVGKGSIYAPVGFISAGMATTDTIIAEYVRSNPQSAYGANYETVIPPGQINHISYVEYWMLRKTAGATLPLTVTLPVTPFSFSTNISTTFIAGLDPVEMQWKHAGLTTSTTGQPSPPYVTGTVTSAPVLLDSIFTLYSSDVTAVNPLPVGLVSFNVTAVNGKALLKWRIADLYPFPVSFELQRAFDRYSFITFNIVDADPAKDEYSCYDLAPQTGINYYRLKIKDMDRETTYSTTVTMQNDGNTPGNDMLLISMHPTTVDDNATLTISTSSIKSVKVTVENMHGEIFKSFQQSLTGSVNSITVDLAGLHNGVYVVWASAEGKRSNAVKFIKN